MNYNFYIVDKDLAKLSSLKRILRRELYKSDLNGSITVRNTTCFINSLKAASSGDVFIIDLDMFSNTELLDKLSGFSKNASIIALLNDEYDKHIVDELINKDITKFMKTKDFSIKLISEYISNEIDGFEARHYIENTDLELSKDIEIETLKIESRRREVSSKRLNEKETLDKVVDTKIYKSTIREKLLAYKIRSSSDKKTISIAGKRHVNIWGNYQFGCELAYMLSKKMPLKILLIDANRLAPSIDMYFGIEKFLKSYEINDDISYNTGLNIAIDAIRKNVLTKELLYDISKPHKKVKNLYFLSGSYNINNYEYYDSKSYIELISICKDSFDVVITLSNDNIYDLYTSISIIKSDINIIPIEAHYDNIRKINNQVSFLMDKQNVSLDKNYIVPFEYMNGVDVGLDYLHDLSICKSVSKISFSKARRSKRSANKCFVEKLDKKQNAEYEKVIKELGYN